jgi:flagellar basal body-associated protein FliL
MEPDTTIPETEPKGSTGPLVGSIIIIIILVVGAIYFWGGKLNKTEENAPAAASVSTSTSDEPAALEQDLQNVPDVPADINNL